MAGILANSASATMVDGDTSVDNAVTGYVTGERVTLSTSPAASATWGLAKPAASTARAELSDETGTSVTFTPDVEGYYVVTAVVSGGAYVLRLSVAALGVVATVSALRLSPLADAQVPTPATGATLYYSTTQSAIAAKLADGSVVTLDVTAVP